MTSFAEDWTVWGDAREPLHTAPEAEAKQFAEEQYPNQDLYVQSPDGREFVFEGGRWVQV